MIMREQALHDGKPAQLGEEFRIAPASLEQLRRLARGKFAAAGAGEKLLLFLVGHGSGRGFEVAQLAADAFGQQLAEAVQLHGQCRVAALEPVGKLADGLFVAIAPVQ
jgi:hypothetical protein